MKDLHRQVRKWISVTSMTLSCGGFYGTMVGFVAKIIFDLQENDMWLFVALPVSLVVAAIMWPRMPRILGFDDD
jgi:hypothetical protein